jgi:hypothetical protein
MLSALVLGSALLVTLGSSPGDLGPVRPDMAAYEAAKAQVGRDADAQVKLALWCEAHGLSAERIKHLTLATLINPAHAAARGLLGLVANDGKWQKPEDVRNQLTSDPGVQAALQEYLQRRAATPDRSDAQWKLAQWCDQAGLKEQALAHYSAVVRLDPRREAAWKKMGYKKSGNRWVKPDQLSLEKAEAEHQRLATRHWKPLVEKYRDGLSAKNPARRTHAETALAGITDPRAVPAVWEVLATGDERSQLMAVQVFGQIDGSAASKAVAALAVFSPSAAVRGRAIETAIRRDPRDFLDSVLALIRKPFRYKVQPVRGLGSEGELFVEGERYNIKRLYRVEPFDASRVPARLFSPDVPFNPFTTPNLLMAAGWPTAMATSAVNSPATEQLGQAIAANPAHAATLIRQHSSSPELQAAIAGNAGNVALYTQMVALQRDQQIAQTLTRAQETAQRAQQNLAQDIQTIESANAGIGELNGRVLPLAKTVSGQDYGADRDAWLKWWNDQVGYAYQSPQTRSKPTYTDVVVYSADPPRAHSACFSAGTTVRSIDGPRAIETLNVGDRVLSQNTTTGALSFQPVVAIHHNPPAATLKLHLGGDTITATGIHRFWKAGKGWTMARELKPGDIVRTLGGTAKLESVESDKPQPVFNLDVAQNRNFFVGKQGCLVYDFSIVQPVPEPFDREPDLTALAAKTK